MELSIGPRPKQNILLLSSFQSSTFTSMSSSDSFAKFHTEAALSLFCKIAVEVISEQGVKGVPSDYELHGLIMKKVLQLKSILLLSRAFLVRMTLLLKLKFRRLFKLKNPRLVPCRTTSLPRI